MVGRPNTTRAMPTRLRHCCAAVGSRRPLGLPPRGAPPATCSGVAGLWHIHGLRSRHMSTIPTASILCQPSAKRSPTQPTVRAWPNAVPLQRCQKVSQSLGRSSPPRTRGCATWHSPSSQPPHTLTPPPCLCCTPCPVSARCSAACCSTTSTRATASPGSKISSPRAAWGNGARHRQATAWGPQGPQSATPISRGPFLQLPCCASETIQPRSNPAPAWRKNLTKARPEPSWPSSGPVPSTLGSHARWRSIRRRFAHEKGGARRSLKPHWTTQGMPLKEALHTAACLASVNATVPRGHETLSPALC